MLTGVLKERRLGRNMDININRSPMNININNHIVDINNQGSTFRK